MGRRTRPGAGRARAADRHGVVLRNLRTKARAALRRGARAVAQRTARRGAAETRRGGVRLAEADPLRVGHAGGGGGGGPGSPGPGGSQMPNKTGGI